ncbi:Hydroxymethylglutaryl-CoA lyase, mitochondrial [Hordeum vulgare]|nr:Hydroxymethylglutaryl-CoA lyase, mitochondrial [Hordeum vulgare]
MTHPGSPPMLFGYTMMQAQAHYNIDMVEGQPGSEHTSVLERLLEQHRLALSEINDERASQDALATMAATNPNFDVEQRAIYVAICCQVVARQEVAATEAQLQATAEENNGNCTSYLLLMNHQAARWDDESQDATIFLMDLTLCISIGDSASVALITVVYAKGFFYIDYGSTNITCLND